MKNIIEKINKEWCPITWTLNERLSDKDIYVFNAKIGGITLKAQANADEPTRLYAVSFVESFSNFEMDLLKAFLKEVVENEKDSYAVDTLREKLRKDIEEQTQEHLDENYSGFKKSDETGNYYMDDVEERATEEVIDDFVDNSCYPDFFNYVLKKDYNGMVYISKENIFVKKEN